MARKPDGIIAEYVGINVNTYEVEGVSEWRSGKMTGPRGSSHHRGNRTASNEALVVFHLTDVFSYPVQMWQDDWVKEKRAELRAKAESMKADAAKRGS